MIPLIGFSGRKRSGKDTAAERLTSAHGYTRFAFADRMRAALYTLDPLVMCERCVSEHPTSLRREVDTVGWEVAKENSNVRAMLQRFGTQVGREQFGADFWVNLTLRDIYEHMALTQGPPQVVLTDVRFPNEADVIRSSGGKIYRIERPGFVRTSELPHPSETALDGYDFDAVLFNSRSIADLHAAVDQLLSH